MVTSTRHRRGFTLIELLVVLGILGILVSIVLVAINPLSQLEFAQNGKRKSYVLTIGNAATQHLIKHGEYPVAGIPSGVDNAMPICRPGITDASCLNIDAVVPDFIAALPIDVAETSAVVTGYRIFKQGFSIAVCNDYLPTGGAYACTGVSEGGGGSSASSSVASSAEASSLGASSAASSAAASSSEESSSSSSSAAASSAGSSSEDSSSNSSEEASSALSVASSVASSDISSISTSSEGASSFGVMSSLSMSAGGI